MNLLAHLFLASISLPNTNGQELTASMMADYYHGNDVSRFPQGMQIGFFHHKAIDQFTDTNNLYKEYRKIISSYNPPHLTSGIIADVFFDYILASNWKTFTSSLCNMNLRDFCSWAFKEMKKAEEWHSPGFSNALTFMYENSWLILYSTIDGIEQTLNGLSEKMSGKPDLASCINILIKEKDLIYNFFYAFWNEILPFSRNWINNQPVDKSILFAQDNH